MPLTYTEIALRVGGGLLFAGFMVVLWAVINVFGPLMRGGVS